MCIFECVTGIDQLPYVDRFFDAQDYYELVENPFRRLKTLSVSFDQHGRGTEEQSVALSAMFLSIIHNAPKLEDFTYKFQYETYGPRQYALLEAVKVWNGYRGVRSDSLRNLNMSGWSLDPNLFTHPSHKLVFPNIKTVQLKNCGFSIRNNELSTLFKDSCKGSP